MVTFINARIIFIDCATYKIVFTRARHAIFPVQVGECIEKVWLGLWYRVKDPDLYVWILPK